MTTCPECSAEFDSSFRPRVYCSVACQSKAANARTNARRGKRTGLKTPADQHPPIQTLHVALQALPATVIDADGRVFHLVQIETVKPGRRYRALYAGRELGVWRDPEHCAARALLDLGIAQRGDTMRTYRGSAPAMRMNIGWAADHTAADPATGSPHWTKWRPFDKAEDEAELAEAA